MPQKILFTAKANSHGGRNGVVESDDGIISVRLSLPREAGGPGLPGCTTPEHLFASGYSACFGSAIELIAHQRGVKLEDIAVAASVGIGPLESGGFGLSVDLVVALEGVEQSLADEIVAAAHEICPYSNAIRGNVPVTVSAQT
jgi:lipoyl-dependent peroxiredoxin